jgi:hypothetical protein
MAPDDLGRGGVRFGCVGNCDEADCGGLIGEAGDEERGEGYVSLGGLIFSVHQAECVRCLPSLWV